MEADKYLGYKIYHKKYLNEKYLNCLLKFLELEDTKTLIKFKGGYFKIGTLEEALKVSEEYKNKYDTSIR